MPEEELPIITQIRQRRKPIAPRNEEVSDLMRNATKKMQCDAVDRNADNLPGQYSRQPPGKIVQTASQDPKNDLA